MHVTKLSTKGQVVIPESVRHGLATGTAFVVSRKDDLIVLKKIPEPDAADMEEIEELARIWTDVDAGKGTTQTRADFLKEIDAL